MIKTIGLLALLLLLYGVAGRIDFERASAQARDGCQSCPCEDDGMRSTIPAPRKLDRIVEHTGSPRSAAQVRLLLRTHAG